MSYYNKDDEHKYRFVIWVAICCAVFLIITILVVVCSVYVYNKRFSDTGSAISNSKAVESMFSSIAPESSSMAQPVSSSAVSSSTEASSSSKPAESSTVSTASQATGSAPYYTGLIVPSPAVPSDFLVNLPVKCIRQNPELPQGCEVTSLAIAMNYKGYSVNKVNLAKFYLPMVDSGYDLSYAEDFFVGDPAEEYPYGTYCLEGAITKTIDNYNKDNPAVSYRTPSSPADLYAELEKGNPVLVWVTLWDTQTKDFEDPDILKRTNYNEYHNLHCMVLSGYSAKEVALVDPMAESDSIDGIRIISRDRFEAVWKAMGNRAISIL